MEKDGASGLVKVLPEAKQGIEARGIRLIVQSANEACQIYNQLCHSQKVIAALYFIC